MPSSRKSNRYRKARTVSLTRIGIEMGWHRAMIKRKAKSLEWILKPYRTNGGYSADVIGVLQAYYGHIEPSTRADRDFLTRYLKEHT